MEMKERKPLGPELEPESPKSSTDLKKPGPSKDPVGMQSSMGLRATIAPGRGSASLGRDIQSKIGLQLRAYYDSLLDPVPPRFTELLNKLDRTESKDRSNDS
jgi:hypothetical protein